MRKFYEIKMNTTERLAYKAKCDWLKKALTDHIKAVGNDSENKQELWEYLRTFNDVTAIYDE